jgi:hypothetical protein
MSLFNHGREIEVECFINPQSAILNPYANHFSRNRDLGRSADDRMRLRSLPVG